jgi:phosphoglucomutase
VGADVWTRLQDGFAAIDVPEETRAAALGHARRWLTEAPFAAWVPAISQLVEAGRFDELLDGFRQVLPFGTGGRRGFVGVGPNRLNPWTVGTSIEGHARWLRARGLSGAVVVAWDVRCFEDARKVFTARTPLHGLTSRDFGELAARIYAAHGFTAWLLERGATRALSTPELSFTLRELGAVGGLNVSASHNPPDDNGVKVYDEHGGQLVPPLDEELLRVVSGVDAAAPMDWNDAVAAGHIRFLGYDLHERYIALAAASVPAGPRHGLRVLYTPLHGTGTVHEALRAAGFECRVHAPQATLDGAFPTVPNGVANPEIPAAMAHALAAAGDADLVIGTDPDADRIGCEVRHGGGFVHLTGNDLGALVIHGLLQREWPRRPLVIKTEVTSAFVTRVAEAGGAAVVDDLLVGFKYVAEGLAALERGPWRGLDPAAVQFVCGVEESHGLLVTDRIRDKDSAGAAVQLCWLAAEAKARGETLIDVLHHLQDTLGYVKNDQVTLAFPGATGASKMAALLDRLRASPPASFGEFRVTQVVDHRDEGGRLGPFVSDSDRAARNVLVYTLAPGDDHAGGRLIFRPSGTEPKLKIYLELSGLPGQGRAGVDRAIAASKAALAALT